MIKLFKIHTPPNIGEKIQKVFDEGQLTEGKYSDEFENKFSILIENKNTCLVNSGTSALSLAYHSIGLKPGDEVISTPMTCMATNEPLDIMGVKIVWSDIDPLTGNICPTSIKNKITKKTKAIVGVHWAGQPFDIDSVNSIAKQYNLKVVEDAAHALGSKYNNKPIGSHSDYVCFSFQAIKHLTTIDGGAITCKTNAESTRIRKLRWFGLDRKYIGSKWEQDITESGFKYHMNNVNSVIGLEQLNYIDNIIRCHKNNKIYYDTNINNKKIIKTKNDDKSESSSWIYTILVEDRNAFKQYLLSNGIESDVVHVRNDKYSVFKKFRDDHLPGCDYFCSRMITIPVGWWLSEDDLKKIVTIINNY